VTRQSSISLGSVVLAAACALGCFEDPPPVFLPPIPPPLPPRPADAGFGTERDAEVFVPTVDPEIPCDDLFGEFGRDDVAAGYETLCDSTYPFAVHHIEIEDPFTREPPVRVCWRVRRVSGDPGWRAGQIVEGSGTFAYLTTGAAVGLSDSTNVEWTFRFVASDRRPSGGSFRSAFLSAPEARAMVEPGAEVRWVFGFDRTVSWATDTAVVFHGREIPAAVQALAMRAPDGAVWVEPDRMRYVDEFTEWETALPGSDPGLVAASGGCPSWLVGARGTELVVATAECGTSVFEVVPASPLPSPPDELALLDGVLIVRTGESLAAYRLSATGGLWPEPVDPALDGVVALAVERRYAVIVRTDDVIWATADGSGLTPTGSPMRLPAATRARAGTILRAGGLYGGSYVIGSAGIAVAPDTLYRGAPVTGPRFIPASRYGDRITAAQPAFGMLGVPAIILATSTPLGSRILWAGGESSSTDCH
jgi:hypothetical protein